MSLGSDSNRCFVCGPGNDIGLKVTFRLEADTCVAEFTPDERHVGYEGVTHGGILFSLLDDVMANWLWLKGIPCFTARADIRYREQLPIGAEIRLESRRVKEKGRLVLMSGQAIRSDTEGVVAEANASFMIQN